MQVNRKHHSSSISPRSPSKWVCFRSSSQISAAELTTTERDLCPQICIQEVCSSVILIHNLPLQLPVLETLDWKVKLQVGRGKNELYREYKTRIKKAINIGSGIAQTIKVFSSSRYTKAHAICLEIASLSSTRNSKIQGSSPVLVMSIFFLFPHQKMLELSFPAVVV